MSEFSYTPQQIKDDLFYYNYCSLNKNNPICYCIFPPNTIKLVELNFFQPYYCWFDGCIDDDVNLITNHIKNLKKNCNTTNCTIKIDQIKITGSNQVIIQNKCAQGISKNIIVNELKSNIKNLNLVLVNKMEFFLIVGTLLSILVLV